jgi:hypothetical protein
MLPDIDAFPRSRQKVNQQPLQHFSTKHLQRYVGEFSFRLNEGNCKVESIDRINSMIERIIGKRITYKVLICNA